MELAGARSSWPFSRKLDLGKSSLSKRPLALLQPGSKDENPRKVDLIVLLLLCLCFVFFSTRIPRLSRSTFCSPLAGLAAVMSSLKKPRLAAAEGAGSIVLTEDAGSGGAASLSEQQEHEGNARLCLLRKSMQEHRVSAYLVETQDAHQSEYVCDHDKRREWLTGFTGSAGTALVTATKALIWTDGRYFLQVVYAISSYSSLFDKAEVHIFAITHFIPVSSISSTAALSRIILMNP